MVKPATVEHEFSQGTSRNVHRLRVVDTEAVVRKPKPIPKTETLKPEVADDVDDLWDNVPV